MTVSSAHRRRAAHGEPMTCRTSTRWSTAGLFVAVTWLVSPVFLILQSVMNLDTETLMLVQFAPGSAALLVAVLRRRADPSSCGLLVLAVRADRRTGTRAVTGIALVAGVIAIGWVFTSLADHHLQGIYIHGLTQPLALILVAQFLGAAGEELGWRGFLLPHLQERCSKTLAVVIVGIAWASWHVQYYAFGPVFMAAFVAMCIAITAIMTTIQEGARSGSLYITTSIHWALNIGILLVLPIGDTHVMTMICLAGAAAAVAIATHRRTSPLVRSGQ
jgi:membrane protease YdiL (CAAX protease family)